MGTAILRSGGRATNTPRLPRREVGLRGDLSARLDEQRRRTIDIVALPMPKKIMREGLRLPASYANFYIANTCVVVPTFADSADQVALSILRECFPSRRVIGIDCRELIWGLGTFHCLTQQQPSV